MPHSTSEYRARSPNLATPFKFPDNMRTSMEKFPDHVDSFDAQPEHRAPSPKKQNGVLSVSASQERWQPRRDGRTDGSGWRTGRAAGGGRSHGRQKSLSDAIRTIRMRKASVSANAHEIAEALKAPVSPKLIVRKSEALTLIHC
jgi:solute carrier family 35 protein E1